MLGHNPVDDRLGSAFKRWVSSGTPVDEQPKRSIMIRFLEYLDAESKNMKNLTTETLIQRQKARIDDYEILDQVQSFVRKQHETGLKLNTSLNYYFRLRGFFEQNRCSLVKDRTFKLNEVTPPTISRFELGELASIIMSCDLRYRALFASMFQGGMGLNEAIKWSNTGLKKLREQIASDIHPIRIDFGSRKLNNKPYYTFIGSDAIKFLKLHLERLPTSTESIFISESGENAGQPITGSAVRAYWVNHLASMGVINRQLKPQSCDTNRNTALMDHEEVRRIRVKSSRIRYGRGLHEMRDTYLTTWHKAKGDLLLANFCMGHSVDRLGYDKFTLDLNYTKNEWLKVEPYLNIFTDVRGSSEVTELSGKLQDAEAQLSQQTATISNLNRLTQRLVSLDPKSINRLIDFMERNGDAIPEKTGSWAILEAMKDAQVMYELKKALLG